MEGRLAAPGEGERYLRMVNNFFIIYDAGYTMDVAYKDTGLTRLEAEKQILLQSNATLPDLGWQAGLYPHWKGGLWLHGSRMAFKPYYELKRFDQAAYGKAIEQLPVKPTGPPMIQRGLMKLESLLGLSGRTEVFIFSDGKHSTAPELEPDPLKQAKILVEKYDVCFTIVSSATTEEGIKLLDDIAAVNGCSQVIDFDIVFDNPEHLFGKLYMDTEQHGFNNVLFDFDKSDVKAEFKPALDKLGQFLLDNPKSYVVLSGFCDSRGTQKYNVKLSRKRAASVRNYLQKHFRIQEDRLLSYWYGYADPVGSNETAEGRALNRRVTITVRLKK
jgi:OOP family OmpA-OmpF porin